MDFLFVHESREGPYPGDSAYWTYLREQLQVPPVDFTENKEGTVPLYQLSADVTRQAGGRRCLKKNVAEHMRQRCVAGSLRGSILCRMFR